MDNSQILVVLAQIATIAFIVENLIEIPSTYWGNAQAYEGEERFQLPRWLKPVLAFFAGTGLGYVFGVRIAAALGLSYVEAVAEYAAFLDAVVLGLVLARGSGFWNKLLNRQQE